MLSKLTWSSLLLLYSLIQFAEWAKASLYSSLYDLVEGRREMQHDAALPRAVV